MKVLLIGSNPSQSSKSTKPFWYDSRSMKTITKWFDRMRVIDPNFPAIESIHFANVANYATLNNKALTVTQIKAELPGLKDKIQEVAPDRVIALGKTAGKALGLLGIDFFDMPHPSGLNRQLNDPAFLEEKLNGLKNHLTSSQTPS